MKNSLKIGLTLFSVFSCFVACKKIQGDNQGLIAANQQANDFMSTKKGSYWTYGAPDGTVFTRTATGKDSIKLGLTYSYYERKQVGADSTFPDYFGKNSIKYITLVDLTGDKTQYVNFILIEDSAKVGDNWNSTETINYSGANINVAIQSSVQSVGGTLVFGSTTYTNVVQVHSDLKAKLTLSPAYTNCGSLNIWFVKGIGIIKEDADISILGFFSKQYNDSLLSYHIEP